MEAGLLPLNADLTAFYTFFCVHEEEFEVWVHGVPPPSAGQRKKPSLKHAKLQCGPRLRDLFRGCEPMIQQRLNQSTDLLAFIMEMKDLLESILCTRSKEILPDASFYGRIYSEIEVLGWEQLAWMGPNLSSLHFRVFDEIGREHIIEITLSSGYPEAAPLVSVDFPSVLDFEWKEGGNLKYILEHFKQAIGKYQDFWGIMEDIDKKVWVMEPERPSRANRFRRIALGGHCSLSIIVDPLVPRALPECRFFGSETFISPLRKKLNCNIRRWKMDRMLLANLEDVLEIKFPSPLSTAEHEDMSADCGICYAYRLSDGGGISGEGMIPDRACDNATCGRPFHTSCLVEWLRSIPTTRQSYDVLFGCCPYCSHPMAVKAI